MNATLPQPQTVRAGLRDAVARRHRRTSLLVAAALVGVLSLSEPLYRPAMPLEMVIRGVWVLLLLLTAWLVVRADAASLAWILPVSAVVQMLAFWAGVVATGGVESPDFRYVSLLPLALAMIYQDELVATVAAGGAMTLCVALARVAPGGTAEWADMLASTVGMGALASFGSWSYRRLRVAELTHQHSRTEAVRQLVLSEQRRAQSERLALLGQLSAGVAHEISSPLAYVSANVQLLAEESVQGAPALAPAERRGIVDDIQHGVTRIRQIVGDLKGYARGDSGTLEELAAEEAISDALRLASMKLGKEVEVRRLIAHDLPHIRVYRRKLCQVLLNLLVNAADALASARVLKPCVVVSADLEGAEVCISVQDNGPGIHPDVAGRLFQPFASTKPDGQGTGLGLALAREYVTELGGRLELVPCEQGARFAIRLPPVSR